MNFSASLTGLVDRMDDWVNPIVVKELRQAVKSRVITSVILLFLIAQVIIMGIGLSFQGINGVGSDGTILFTVLQAILLGTCMILIPSYAAARMAGERSDSNVDLLFISTLRPTSIIAGKFFSAMVLSMLIFACCAPFMTFTYLMRGLDIPSILVVFLIDLLAIIGTTQFALFLISLPVPTAFKNVLVFLSSIQFIYIYAFLIFGTGTLIHQGIPSGTAFDADFWIMLGLSTLGTLLATGLIFCWSVAMISPPSANRAMPGRIFLAASVIILGIACIAPLIYFVGFGRGVVTMDLEMPIVFWTVFSVMIFCLNLLISVNEREAWGPRVTRTIPRLSLFRLFAFFFYSGAAGGVLYSVIGIGLTLLTWSWASDVFLTHPGINKENILLVLGAIALFTYCYCMTAMLIRHYLFSKVFRRDQTWVVLIFLLAIGCIVPWLIALLTNSNEMYTNSFYWWFLANPFGAIPYMESWRSSDGFTYVCFLFLFIWATLVSLLSVNWFFKQFRLFRRFVPRNSSTLPELAEPFLVPPSPLPAEAR